MSVTAVESRHHDNSDVTPGIKWEDSGIVIGKNVFTLFCNVSVSVRALPLTSGAGTNFKVRGGHKFRAKRRNFFHRTLPLFWL